MNAKEFYEIHNQKEFYFIKSKIVYNWCTINNFRGVTETNYYDWYLEKFVPNKKHLSLKKLYTCRLSKEDAERILNKLKKENKINKQLLDNATIIKRV